MSKISITYFCVISGKCFIKAKIKVLSIALISKKLITLVLKLKNSLENPGITFTPLIFSPAKALSPNFPLLYPYHLSLLSRFWAKGLARIKPSF